MAALFQPADFPAAFKAQPDQGGDCPASSDTCASLNLEPLWSELTSYLGVADNPQARATSPTYKENLATQARVTVEYTTVSSAAAIATALAGPKFQACANSAFTADAKRSAPQGATPGPVSIAPLSGPLIASLAGQTVSASRVNVTMNLGNLPIMINQDFLVIFKGGAIIRMFFLNPGGPFPPSLEQSLVQKVATRAGT